ncbi:unnamed protein product [Caenorhabditis auriculariae]|uniref:TM2 domain-containing protein n=1 Tax=Caenorhabditis auriculariae TaxID=2777116 RepID=A0A8S1GYI9_9PELO|nr:unnamed protein product [Caenorhabditis auriculariae]
MLRNFAFYVISLSLLNSAHFSTDFVDCTDLDKLQFYCNPSDIDSKTQQPTTCAPDNSITVRCRPSSHISCKGLDSDGFFNRTIENGCHYETRVSYYVAVLLSIFFGIFGVDRFYLGYYAIGLMKMFSLGGLFLFWLIDVVLITLQILGPADGSNYFMPFYGPKVTQMRFDEQTNYSTYTCIDCL